MLCKYMGDGTECRWQCPEGCGLPRTCYTCGYTPCVYFNDPEHAEEKDCWIPPYWYDREDTYWLDQN